MGRLLAGGFLLIAIILASLMSIATCSQIDTLNKIVENIQQSYKLLETKVNELEGKNVELEMKVKQLEGKVRQLENKTVQPNQISTVQKSVHRSCHEMFAADASLISGFYWIDPDGHGAGDDPINVYCEMTTGSTSVLHDSESEIDVGNCAEPGCYSRKIKYHHATTRQMSALAELSNECHQSIRYDCIGAPLELNGVAYSWWNDRNGIPRHFWSGNNSSAHTCQCGIDGTCLDSSVKCNCDSALPTQMVDKGIITDKRYLPITRLNFGRTQLATGLHTLGRLECRGQVTVVGKPQSCTDLWRIGHTFSGLYLVMGTNQVESVYCDFTKLPTDSSFQKWIGYNSVKSSPVYFYVQRLNRFNTTRTPIPFEVERLNIGKAMNLNTGIFTAPRPGTYFFTTTANVVTSSSKLLLDLGIFLNGNQIGTGAANDADATFVQAESFSFHSTLNLQAGDQLWLQITGMSTGTSLFDNKDHFTHFSGWLLEENISQSLNVK